MASHKSLKMSKKTTTFTGKQDFQIAFRAMKNSATPKPDTLRSITANNGSLQHPLAKYNVNGKLTCKLCNLQISNDKLWPVHLKSKTHSDMEKRLRQLSDKDGKRARKCDVIHQSNGTIYSGANTEELSTKISTVEFNVSEATSTPPPTTPPTTTTTSSSSSGSNVQNNTKPLKSILKNRIHSPPPIIAKKAKFTYNEDNNNNNCNLNNTTDNVNINDSSSMLPMGFFDTANNTTTTTTTTTITTTTQPEYSHALANSESVESSTNIGAAQQSSTLATDTSTDQLSSSFTDNQEGLPEGFFDDPFKDAKIRGVETLEETQEREWEEFKRSIQSEDIVSDELVAEREQGEQIDRDYSQVFEQSQFYFRAESLRAKQESLWLMKTQNEGNEMDTTTATSNYTDLNSDMQIDIHATECTDTSTSMVVDECRNNETDVATSVEGNSETNENSDDDNDNYSDTDFNWRAQHL